MQRRRLPFDNRLPAREYARAVIQFAVENLFEGGRRIELSAGDILHDVHDSCNALGRLVSGKLHLAKILSSGREIVMKEFLPGELYAELIVFTGDSFPGWLIAVEDSVVIEVERERLLEHLSNSDSLVSFIKGINQKMQTLNAKIEILSLKTVQQRIAYCIISDGSLPVSSVSRTAAKLGCSREALSRCISEMRRSGAVYREKDMLLTGDLSLLEQVF